MQFRATEGVREFKAQCLLKLAPKESQLFLKWWLATHADAGIHSIEWENRSEAEHHFLRVKLLTWWEKNGLQLRQIKTTIPNQCRSEEKNSSFLRWNNACAYWTSLAVASVRPERLLPLLFASTCAPSGNCGWITEARCFAHSDLRVTQSLWSSAPRRVGRSYPAQLV